MTHDTTQPGQDDTGSNAEAASLDSGGESLPEILEVFGAAPLVPDGDFGETAHEIDDEPRRDSHGRFVSHDDDDASDDDAAPEPRDEPRAERDEPARDEPAELAAARDEQPAASDARLGALQDVCERLVDQLALSEERLARIETSVEELARQTSFLPPKLRGLGSKVDDLTNGLGDERTRGLLEDVVSVLDLVEGARQRFPEDAEDGEAREARRYLDALGTRIGQILESHQVREIDIDGAFDPERHHAVERVDVSDPARDGAIVSVVRRGWTGGDRVLRYADVTVGRFDADADADASPAADSPPVIDLGAPDEAPAASADEPASDEAPTDELPVATPVDDPNELDALTPPPGEAPKTVTDTDSASITFRPTQRRNRG